MKGQMRVHYDQEGDLLEISTGKPTKCYTTEIQPGIFLRHRKSTDFRVCSRTITIPNYHWWFLTKDEKTNEVKSIGILDFKKRSEKLNDLEIQLPVSLEIAA